MKKIITLIAVLFLMLPVSAHAQNERTRLSTSEDIAIAYYRTAGVIPDFKKWVWGHAPHKYTPAAMRPDVFDKEMARVQAAFFGFNKRRDYLTLKIPVDVMPREENGKYHLGLVFKGLDQSYYVSTSFLKEHIAIFPYNMDSIMDGKVNEVLYKKLRTIEAKKDMPYIVAVMEAKEADPNRPYIIDNISQWLLKTQIQFITLYTKDGSALWEYTAPINLSPN